MAEQFPPITGLIPQRPPFLFIRRIEGFDAQKGELVSSTSFSADSLAVNKEGLVTQSAIIEALAQSAAALVGLKNPATDQPPIGYLAAVSAFDFNEQPSAGTPLRLQVQTTREFGQFMIVQGSCYAADKLLATGELTFFLDQ